MCPLLSQAIPDRTRDFGTHFDTDGQNRTGYPDFFPINADWSLFTGTPGPNRKAIFYVENNGQASFLKVACTSNARALCYIEAHAIETLQDANITSFTYPRIIHQGLDLLVVYKLRISLVIGRSSRCSEMPSH